MLTLPTKFAAENAKLPNKPAYIAQIQEESYYRDQTLATDWAAAAASSNVDIAASPGDVSLTEIFPVEENQAWNGDLSPYYSPGGLVVVAAPIWQSFKQVSGLSRVLDTIRLKITGGYPGGFARITLFASDRLTQIGTTVEVDNLPSGGPNWIDFVFFDQTLTIADNTEYWIFVEGGPYSSISAETITLSTYNAFTGTKIKVVRASTCTGAYNLNIGSGPLKALSNPGSSADFEYNGTSWVLTASTPTL